MSEPYVITERCRLCHDRGAILARHKEDFSAWAFKCNCSAGRNDRRNFPKWESKHLEKFEVV
jgi:hypothetical protein